jgi:hypothetical protein
MFGHMERELQNRTTRKAAERDHTILAAVAGTVAQGGSVVDWKNGDTHEPVAPVINLHAPIPRPINTLADVLRQKGGRHGAHQGHERHGQAFAKVVSHGSLEFEPCRLPVGHGSEHPALRVEKRIEHKDARAYMAYSSLP